mmetsp:Transcript_17946/g.60104  ORF Transcript_17946/g.60104 Transcript_17946/m.60104 type:complete len:215 (-) Transcript_17946:113-757(-)
MPFAHQVLLLLDDASALLVVSDRCARQLGLGSVKLESDGRLCGRWRGARPRSARRTGPGRATRRRARRRRPAIIEPRSRIRPSAGRALIDPRAHTRVGRAHDPGACADGLPFGEGTCRRVPVGERADRLVEEHDVLAKIPLGQVHIARHSRLAFRGRLLHGHSHGPLCVELGEIHLCDLLEPVDMTLGACGSVAEQQFWALLEPLQALDAGLHP